MRRTVSLPHLHVDTYRGPKNLRNLLTKATLKPHLTVHEVSSRWRRPRGKTLLINTDTTFSIALLLALFFCVPATATCKTRNIIYLIECKACGIQYVVETENAVHSRMNGHAIRCINVTILTDQWQHISIRLDIRLTTLPSGSWNSRGELKWCYPLQDN